MLWYSFKACGLLTQDYLKMKKKRGEGYYRIILFFWSCPCFFFSLCALGLPYFQDEKWNLFLFCFGILNNVSEVSFETTSLYIQSCCLAALDQNQNISVQKPTLWSFLLTAVLLFNILIFIKISISVIWKKTNLIRWDGTGLLISFSKFIPQSLVTSSDFLVTNSDFWQNLLF